MVEAQPIQVPPTLPPPGVIQPHQQTVSIVKNVIPKDAIKIGPKVYLWSDPLGVRWIYEETTLGVAKMELIPITLSLKDEHTVVFEQPSPFGMAHIEKDTADLSPVERRLYDEYMEKQKKPADRTDKTDKP
jgi:hypothetical protein